MNKRLEEETASAVLAPAIWAGLKNIQDEKRKRRSAHRTTAAICHRFALPKFFLHCVPQKLHIAAGRYKPFNPKILSIKTLNKLCYLRFLLIKKGKIMFKQIIFIITCLLFAGKSMAQHTYGSFYTHDALINYILSEHRTENAAIVMIPGANLSTYIYVTTPDGRKGWSELFADKGYDVYMVNDPRYDFATGGFVAPYTVPADGKEATPGSQQGWQNDIWRRWGFGSSQGNPYPDARFPTDFFDVFAQNYPYIGTSNASYSDAIQAVIDSTASQVWLIAHSAGASRAVTATRQKKEQVNGLILIEPAGPPDADDFPDLDGLHMFGVYGDYIPSRNQTNRKLATEAAAILFQNAGGVADVVSLPEDSLVFGNSHLLMQDRNSEDVFDIIEHWLRQFGTNTVGVESKPDNKTGIVLYPNPTGNDVWIEGKSMNGHEYCIYSIDGRIFKKSMVENHKIDLSGAPNGLLFVRFRYNERFITKKLIKTACNSKR